MYVYVKARRKEELEGLVLPLYEKFNIKMNEYTYEYLLQLYYEYKEMQTVYRIYGMIKADKSIDITYNGLNIMLETSIKVEDVDMIVEILRKF